MNNKIIFSTIALIASSTFAHADSVEIKKCNTAYEKKDYIDALDYCRAAAKLKNPTALHKLGLMAELGQGSKEDYPQAMQYYKQSAKMGNLDAYYNIALLYQKGLGVESNISEAIVNYKYAANRGQARAQHNLAFLYETSLLPIKDEKKAFHYYTKAVEQGLTLSETPLATMYAEGRGCKHDGVKALTLYKKVLLREDNPEAQHNIGLLVARGDGAAKNDILAYALWENNAAPGYLGAAVGYADSAYNRDVIAKRMTPSQITEAKELAKKFSKERKKMIMMITPTESKKNLPKLL